MSVGLLSPDAALRVLSDLGVVLPGALLHTYVSGSTSTPLATYSESTLTTPNANPIVAGAGGLFGAIYLTPGLAYKYVLATAAGVTVWTRDPVGVNAALGPIDVRDYGALGDGVTDDSAAIQAALDAAAVGQGQTVTFGSGGSVYAVKQLQLSAHARLTGGGGPLGTRLLRIAGGTGPVIRMKAGARAIGLLLEDFQVDVDHQEGGTLTVTGATNATPIVITTSAAHGLFSGTLVNIASVGGNAAANGEWRITRVAATTFSLDGSIGSGAYTSGGVVTVHCTGIALGDEATTDYSLGSSIQNVFVTNATGYGIRLRCNAIGEARNVSTQTCRRGWLVDGAVFYGYNLNTEESTLQEFQLEAFASAIYGLQIENATATNNANLDVVEVSDGQCLIAGLYCTFTGITRRSIVGLLASAGGTFGTGFVGVAITNAGGTFTNLIYDSQHSLSVPPGITHRTLAFYDSGNTATPVVSALAALQVGDGVVGDPSIAFLNGYAGNKLGFAQLAVGFLSLVSAGVHGLAWNNAAQYMKSAFELDWTTGTPFGTVDLRVSRSAAKTLSVDDGAAGAAALKVVGAFGCNTKTPQAAAASGGALNAYGAGANGLDTGANMSALHALVVAMRAALVANGIMS